MHVQIDTAGISRELEMRISLACGLLAADQLQVDTQPWKGRNCDVLVVDMQSGYGQLAYEVAKRKSVAVLGFDDNVHENRSPGVCQLDRHAPVAAITKALREMLLPLTATVEGGVTGLLDVCLREAGCATDLHVKHGQVAVILRPAAGRIHARSVSDLLAAEARLLNSGWLPTLASELQQGEASWHITRSLDCFLVIACHRFQGRLPALEHRVFKLTRWPDLGNIPDDGDSLRLAALLHQSAWTVGDLAHHAGVDVSCVNAFCWAMMACGALASGEPPSSSAVSRRTTPPPASSILQRVARHFGVRLGHGHFRA